VNWRSLTTAKLAVGIIFAAAVIYNIPRFFEREVVTAVTCSGHVISYTRKTPLRTNRNYFLAYKTVCYFVFRSVGPLIVVVLLNFELVRALQVIHLRRRQLSQKTKHRENLTLMLVTVVSVFVVCQLPDLGIRVAFTCAEFAPRAVVLDISALRYANAASNALLTLNSAVNFLIYCLVGRKFRCILLREICHVGVDTSSLARNGDTSQTELTHHNCHQQLPLPLHQHIAAPRSSGQTHVALGNDSGNHDERL
jgi:neuropeptide Y receptor type 1